LPFCILSHLPFVAVGTINWSNLCNACTFRIACRGMRYWILWILLRHFQTWYIITSHIYILRRILRILQKLSKGFKRIASTSFRMPLSSRTIVFKLCNTIQMRKANGSPDKKEIGAEWSSFFFLKMASLSIKISVFVSKTEFQVRATWFSNEQKFDIVNTIAFILKIETYLSYHHQSYS